MSLKICLNLFNHPPHRGDRRKGISKLTTSFQSFEFMMELFSVSPFVDILLAILCKWANKLSNKIVKFKVFTFIVDSFFHWIKCKCKWFCSYFMTWKYSTMSNAIIELKTKGNFISHFGDLERKSLKQISLWFLMASIVFGTFWFSTLLLFEGFRDSLSILYLFLLYLLLHLKVLQKVCNFGWHPFHLKFQLRAKEREWKSISRTHNNEVIIAWVNILKSFIFVHFSLFNVSVRSMHSVNVAIIKWKEKRARERESNK